MKVQTCRKCGCTDFDCGGCIMKTGRPCHWVENDLCSACVEPPKTKPMLGITDMGAYENPGTMGSGL